MRARGALGISSAFAAYPNLRHPCEIDDRAGAIACASLFRVAHLANGEITPANARKVPSQRERIDPRRTELQRSTIRVARALAARAARHEPEQVDHAAARETVAVRIALAAVAEVARATARAALKDRAHRAPANVAVCRARALAARGTEKGDEYARPCRTLVSVVAARRQRPWRIAGLGVGGKASERGRAGHREHERERAHGRGSTAQAARWQAHASQGWPGHGSLAACCYAKDPNSHPAPGR